MGAWQVLDRDGLVVAKLDDAQTLCAPHLSRSAWADAKRRFEDTIYAQRGPHSTRYEEAESP